MVYEKSMRSQRNNSLLLEYVPGVVGWCEGVLYLTSSGRPTDIGLQLGKACYPCSRQGKRGNVFISSFSFVTTEHSYLRLSALADYTKLLNIYSISDNCVRGSTLWLSGKSIGFLSGRTGFESHDQKHRLWVRVRTASLRRF